METITYTVKKSDLPIKEYPNLSARNNRLANLINGPWTLDKFDVLVWKGEPVGNQLKGYWIQGSKT